MLLTPKRSSQSVPVNLGFLESRQQPIFSPFFAHFLSYRAFFGKTEKTQIASIWMQIRYSLTPRHLLLKQKSYFTNCRGKDKTKKGKKLCLAALFQNFFESIFMFHKPIIPLLLRWFWGKIQNFWINYGKKSKRKKVDVSFITNLIFVINTQFLEQF